MDIKQFSLPITGYVTSYFLTARLAAQRMVANKSEVYDLKAKALGMTCNSSKGTSQARLTRDVS